MNRLISAATVVVCGLSILAGCTKSLSPAGEEPTGNEATSGSGRIQLMAEGYTGETKTSVLDNSAVWVNGDRVKIVGFNNTFSVTVSGGKAYINAGDLSGTTTIYASYPSGIFYYNNSTIDFPSSYTSTLDASGRQVIALPMMAYADNTGGNVQALEFKHQTAAVKVMLWNATATTLTVTRVRVKTDRHQINGAISTGNDHAANPASNLTVIPDHPTENERQVDVNFPAPGEYGALTLAAGDQSHSVQVPIYPIGKDQMTIEVYLTDGTFKYVYSYKATNPALARNQMMTAKAKLDLNGNMRLDAVDLSQKTEDYVAQNGDILTGTLTGNHQITIADGATVALKDVNITSLGTGALYAGITCQGDATILLSGSNYVMGGISDGTQGLLEGDGVWPGIFVPEKKTLTIDGTGSLYARSNGREYASGIGGAPRNPAGNIVIQGGTVEAQGGKNCAGIGDGSSGCGNIFITGSAKVTATGGENGAGIGGGWNSSCGNITISTTGTVTAQGGSAGAGIGSGSVKNGGTSQCGYILISKGTIVATGGNNAAGIGTGNANGNGS